MRRVIKGSLTAALGLMALQSCGSDDSSSGSGGSGGTGGTTGGTGGTTGGTGGATGGTGGAPDASPDVADASDGGLVCDPLPSEAGVDAATAQWRDWAANACNACPASEVTCSDVVGPNTIFDPIAKTFTITLAPGIAEIVSGTVSFDWDAVDADGGFITGSVTPLALTVDKNTLTANLVGQIPDGVVFLHQIVLELDDACGQHSKIDTFGWDTSVVDGGTSLNIHCEQ